VGSLTPGADQSPAPRVDRITPEKIAKYLETTRKAFAKVTVVAPPRSFAARMAENFLDMARRYYEDAKHSHSKGDDVQAFAQVNYAHGWLDAGARLGIFDVGQDDVLFTLLD
jgi:uncharacterized protein